jgi:hypothetical protein
MKAELERAIRDVVIANHILARKTWSTPSATSDSGAEAERELAG